MTRQLVDTNVLIRFLTQDDAKLAKRAEVLLRQAKKDELIIPDYIMCELVWVLLAVYQLSKKEVIEKLQAMVDFEAFAMNRRVVGKAIEVYGRREISFVDAMLLSQAKIDGTKLVSFDKRLVKVLGQKG